VIGLVARFDPMKDHATALAALRMFPEAHLVAAGKGVVPTNPALAAPDLSGRLHLLGERRDVEELLPALDIATLSSAFGEGFPNVLGEAMACGIPCVATDVGDSKEVIDDTGLVVPPRDAGALSRAWRELARASDDRLASLGEAARARVVAHWSLPAVVRTYEETYRSMLI
jgi:glycosyltransferase involved in cell wall biosynthesis